MFYNNLDYIYHNDMVDNLDVTRCLLYVVYGMLVVSYYVETRIDLLAIIFSDIYISFKLVFHD